MMKLSVLSILIFIHLSTYAQEQFIEIEGKKIWVHTKGIADRKPGEPLIVFESGLGTPLGHWDTLLEGVSELGPWLAYDRPGIGKSEPDEEMPTIQNVSQKLLKILEAFQLEPPYLLVGHSLGGVYVRGFAVYHPEKLAGLVIIDPGDFTETQENKRLYYKVFGWDDAKIDEQLLQIEQTRKSRRTDAPKSIKEESQVLKDLRVNDFQEIANSPLPNIPVHILAGGRLDYPKKFHSKEYDEYTLFQSKMKYRLARWIAVVQSVDKGMFFYSSDAGHFVHRDDPELALSSIKIALEDYAEMKK